MRCCNIISDLITGVIPTSDPEVPVEPQFLTYAFVADPDTAGFIDWQFIGIDSFDFCTFTPAYSTYFGVDSLGCFNGASDVASWYSNWAGLNGTPYPNEASLERDHTDLAAYAFAYYGNNAPPDMQITDSLGNPITPVWEVISPVCRTITFTVDDINDGCLIHAFASGYDDLTTYEFGVFTGEPVIGDAAWPAFMLNAMPKATPATIDVVIVGNQVTVTIENTFEYIRGWKWENPVTLATGTAFFTTC